MLVISTAIVAAALVELTLLAGISNWYSGEELWEAVRYALNGEERIAAGVFLLATVCSCGFWTLVARTVLGGMVFTVISQLDDAVVVADEVLAQMPPGIRTAVGARPARERAPAAAYSGLDPPFDARTPAFLAGGTDKRKRTINSGH